MASFSFMLVDTPSYLLSSQNHPKAVETLNYLLGDNKHLLTEEGVIKLGNYEKAKQEDNLSVDYKAISIFMWVTFAQGIVFTGTIAYIPLVVNKAIKLSVSEQVVRNMFILISFDIPANVVSGLLPSLECIKKKNLLILVHLIGSIFLLSSFVISNVALALGAGLGCFSAAASMSLLIAAEYFPSVQRDSMIGLTVFAARIGKIAAIGLVWDKHPEASIISITLFGLSCLLLSIAYPEEK